MEKKYGMLRACATMFWVFAWIVLMLGVIGSIIMGATAGGGVGAYVGIMGCVAAVIYFIILAAASRLIYLFIDVEQNTRDTAERLKRGE
jgi:membrane associated rhomboid family serine protease